MILTDDRGVPFKKPDPEDFATTGDFLHAMWAYQDAIADAANRAFDYGFREALKHGRRTHGA